MIVATQDIFGPWTAVTNMQSDIIEIPRDPGETVLFKMLASVSEPEEKPRLSGGAFIHQRVQPIREGGKMGWDRFPAGFGGSERSAD